MNLKRKEIYFSFFFRASNSFLRHRQLLQPHQSVERDCPRCQMFPPLARSTSCRTFSPKVTKISDFESEKKLKLEFFNRFRTYLTAQKGRNLLFPDFNAQRGPDLPFSGLYMAKSGPDLSISFLATWQPVLSKYKLKYVFNFNFKLKLKTLTDSVFIKIYNVPRT